MITFGLFLVTGCFYFEYKSRDNGNYSLVVTK